MCNRLIACCIGLVLASTTASAQSVTYDFNKEVDFSQYRTYAWVRGTPVGDEFNQQRIMDATDAQLAKAGMQRVDSSVRPDVLVAYHANFSNKLRVNAWSSDWGRYRYAGGRNGTATVEELVTGTLIIELFDVERKQVVWRASATKQVDEKASPEKRTKNIDRAVEKLFKNYPVKKS